jgi:hypothetical protein
VDDLAPDLDQQETDTPVPADDPARERADLDEPLFDGSEDDAPNAPDDHGDGDTRTRLGDDG